MIQQSHSPLEWIQEWAMHMGWPAVCIGAFLLGRYVKALEHRVDNAEKKLEKLTEVVTEIVERHLSHIHRALSEIRGLIIGGR
jgi:cystathionine beta-lyase/cystathionine gamma-synthase